MGRALTLCCEGTCGELVVRGRCPEHEAEHRKKLNARRAPTRVDATERKWSMVRANYLAKHPTCECDECMLLPEDERPLAEDVHHKVDRAEGGRSNDANLQSMTHAHHSRITAARQAARAA